MVTYKWKPVKEIFLRRSTVSSEISDEDYSEYWAKELDLPGFDSNTSLNNMVIHLFRANIAQVNLELRREINHVEKTYIVFNFTNFCCDVAILEFGPAVQMSLKSVNITDKLHNSSSFPTIPLLNSEEKFEFVTIQFRKVRSDCPDFKSHYHSVEQSLVVIVNPFQIVCHREAITTLSRYLHYFFDKVHYFSRMKLIIKEYFEKIYDSYWFKSKDPPIPPGATKFSYSARVSCLKFHLCDAEIDFVLIKINGFEIDVLFKANERFIIRTYLIGLSIDDISNTSLYPKIFSVEGEKLIEMKYDRRTSHLEKTTIELNSNNNRTKSDGQFKFHLRRINLLVMFKLIHDAEKFLSPFLNKEIISNFIHLIGQKLRQFFCYLRFFNDKIFVSIDCQLPTLLMPYQTSSPNLLVFNTGDLIAENFFKDVICEGQLDSKNPLVMDNTLIRIDDIFMSRAIINLNGSIIVQEMILEHTCCKIDSKRLLIKNQIFNDVEALSRCDMNVTLNKFLINLGQKDLSTLFLVWFNNVEKITQFFYDETSHSDIEEEAEIRKLQEFFHQSERKRIDLVLHANFDGMDLCLYGDIDEVLSSPVRDETRSLCKFKVGEISVQGQYYANGQSEIKTSVQSFHMEDCRSVDNISIRRILQSLDVASKRQNAEDMLGADTSAIFLTMGKNKLSESHCNIFFNYLRFNVSVSFLTDLFKFFRESIPNEESLFDVTENQEVINCRERNYIHVIQQSFNDVGGMSLSITCRKPEIMFFCEVDDFSKNHALFFRSDLCFEYVQNVAKKNFTCVISDLHVLSKFQSKFIDTQSDVIVKPCNIKMLYNWIVADREQKISISCDEIDVHVSASLIHIILNIFEELNTGSSFLGRTSPNKCNSSAPFHKNQDLWSSRKMTPYFLPQNTKQTTETLNQEDLTQSLVVSLPVISVRFEIEDIIQKKPVMLLKMSAETNIRNWSKLLNASGIVCVECSYYNSDVNCWESLLEPTIKADDSHRPWEISVKVFKSKSYPIHTVLRSSAENLKKNNSVSSARASVQNNNDSDLHKKQEKDLDDNSSSNQLDYSDTDSDSEDEDFFIERLKVKLSQLLTTESSDETSNSDSEESFCEEAANDSRMEISEMDISSNLTAHSSLPQRTLFSNNKENYYSEFENDDQTALYLVFEVKESLEMVITSNTLTVIKQIYDSFSVKFNHVLTDTQYLSLKNDIAPQSTVILQSRNSFESVETLMCAHYSLDSSSPSSRNSTVGTPCNLENLSDYEFNPGFESFEKYFASNFHSKLDFAERRKSDDEVFASASQFPHLSTDSVLCNITSRQLRINIMGFEELIVICPTRTTNKCHALFPAKNGIQYHVIISIINDLWGQLITVRSPLQMKNETCYALALYYKKTALNTTGFEQIGEIKNPFDDLYKFAVIEPDEIFNIPIMVTYHCPIYLIPLHENYCSSESGLWWRDLVMNGVMISKNVICKPKNEKSPLFVIRAIITEGVHLSSVFSGIPNFLIRLLPSVIIYNVLPCAFHLKIPAIDFNVRIEAGGKFSLYSVDISNRHSVFVEIPSYFGVTWIGSFNLCRKIEEKLVIMKTEHDVDCENKNLSLNVKIDKTESHHVVIYSPYWIINKTGLHMQIKSSQPDTIYDTFMVEPLFFSFRKSQKKIIRMRACQSSWSSPASIDMAGCSDLVLCRDRERNRLYHVFMEVSLSQLSPSTTKLVTLLPYFLLCNECQVALRYMEENEQADLWVDLPPNQTIPFWPETQSMKMCLKLKDSSFVSQRFCINEACQTVLRMDKGSAIVVRVTGGRNKPFSVVFRHYKDGDAPVRIDNFCEDLFLKISQGCSGQITVLSPYQSLLYTWDEPTEERKLQWNVYNRKNKGFEVPFEADGCGQEFINFQLINQQDRNTDTLLKSNKFSSSLMKLMSKYGVQNSSGEEESEIEKNDSSRLFQTHKGKIVVFWVSYMEGKQRVLLFTRDEELAYYAYARIESEKSKMELFTSIKGIGLSLVKNFEEGSRELAYFSFSDSSSIWEVNIAHNWKILPLELAAWLEHQWIQGVKNAQMRDYVNVNFEKMRLIKPFMGELRRSYYPAVWMHYRRSMDYHYFNWKIHRFQIDNQLPCCEFPIVLYTKVLSSDIVRKYGLQPCLELTLLKKEDATSEDTEVFKFVKLTVLEFHLQVDEYFTLSLFEMIYPYLRIESAALRIQADICKIHHPLVIKKDSDRKTMILEYLYISPIKIRLSFASNKMPHLNSAFHDFSFLHTCLRHFFNCLSARDTTCEAIKINCSYIEEFAILTNISNKLDELYNFYLQNLFRPIYINLFRIEASRNINAETDTHSDYLELFADQHSPLINELYELAEAASDDVRCLLSHISSPSVSFNTSPIPCEIWTPSNLGFNSASLSKKYSKHETGIQDAEPILNGEFCFEIGVVYGLSGVYMNLHKGFHSEAKELFFKRIGKHLLKLMNTYSSTISNISSTAIDCMRRAAETGTDIIFRRRLPKYINPFGMKSFSIHHAIGLNILTSLDKGIYSQTDDYWNHIILDQSGKLCLLMTLQHVFLMTKCDIWDEWKIEWSITVNDIVEEPILVNHKLSFRIKQESATNFDDSSKFINHNDINVLLWLQKMIETIFKINLENKPCSLEKLLGEAPN